MEGGNMPPPEAFVKHFCEIHDLTLHWISQIYLAILFVVTCYNPTFFEKVDFLFTLHPSFIIIL